AAAMDHQMLAGGGGLEDRAVGGEIALENRDAAVVGEGLFDRADDLGIPVLDVLDFGGDGLARDGERIAMELAAVEEGLEDDRQAAGVEELLHQIFARGHEVDDGGDV